jgi:hypothetical protein
VVLVQAGQLRGRLNSSSSYDRGVDGIRARHTLSWVAIGIAAGALVATCFLAAFEVRIEASIGAGSDQRTFSYERELVIAHDLLPFGLLPLAAGLFLVACSAVGVLRGSRPALVVAAFLVAVALGVLVLHTEDRLGWPGAHGVIGYEERQGGLLAPGLDDLHAAARRSPEARDPGWTLTGDANGYAARGLDAWRLFMWSTFALLWLTGFRLARLRFGLLASTLLVVAASLAVMAWLVLSALSNLQ